MKQEQSSEKNLLSTELNSDYRIDKVLGDLEHYAPWELNEFDKDLIDWSETVAFGQTEFQNKWYVVNSQVTPYRQIRQAIMEIQTRYGAIRKINIQYKRCLNDIERIRKELEEEENPFWKKDKGYEIELLLTDKQIWENKVRQAKEELEGLVRILKELAPEMSVEDIKESMENPAIVESEEHKYWIARMAKQSATDLLTTGRIQAGNLESMLQMSPEDQAAITDLAMTYSTAVNRSIGAIKSSAEQKVDKMLEGQPPQMFNTSGVLTDYATNNITDRLLQSADKSKTES